MGSGRGCIGVGANGKAVRGGMEVGTVEIGTGANGRLAHGGTATGMGERGCLAHGSVVAGMGANGRLAHGKVVSGSMEKIGARMARLGDVGGDDIPGLVGRVLWSAALPG